MHLSILKSPSIEGQPPPMPTARPFLLAFIVCLLFWACCAAVYLALRGGA